MQRVRSPHSTCNRYGPPPCEDAGGDQIHHEAKTEARLDIVAFAEPTERAVVRHARPFLLSTNDQAEAIVERNARLDLRGLEHPIRLDVDDVDTEPRALPRRDAPHFFEYGRYDGHPPQMPRYQLEDRQLGIAVVDQYVRVGKQHRGRGPHRVSTPSTHAPAASSLPG